MPLAKKLRANMTFSEVLLWNKLKQKQLGVQFSRQIPIDEYIVDFYAKDVKLAIELDGESHFQGDAPQKDQKRQLRLETLGVRFLRFNNKDIKYNIDSVLSEIQHWLIANSRS